MKKLHLLNILTLLILSSSYGQTDCSELESKNGILETKLTKKEGIIASQNKELSELKTKNNYFKETLDLLNTPNSKEADKVLYRINSVDGDLNVGTISISGTIENLSIVKRWQSKKIQIIDLKGNTYKGRLRFNDGSWAIDKFQRNVPIKFNITFNKILEEAQIIKALIFDMYGAGGKSHIVSIKNLEVQWQ